MKTSMKLGRVHRVSGAALGAMLLGTALLTFSGVSLAETPAPAGNYATGAKVWSEMCGRCHNVRDPMDLRDDEWEATVTHMRVRVPLTGQEARDILTFLQASNGDTRAATATPMAAVTQISGAAGTGLSGEQVYGGSCIACHGANGKGAIPGTPDFTSASGPMSKSDAELIQSITLGRQTPGSALSMPPMGGNPNLSDTEISRVLQHLRVTFGMPPGTK